MRRRTILSRPTPRILSVRSSACSVQGNGCRGALRLLLFPVAGHSVLDSLLGRSQREQHRFLLGMEVHSYMQISVPRFHSLRLPIPEHLFMATGWKRRFRVPCLLIVGALDRLALCSRFLPGRSKSGWSCFSSRSSRHFCGSCAVVDFFLVVPFFVFYAGVFSLTSGVFLHRCDGAIADRVLLLVRRLRRFSLLAV